MSKKSAFWIKKRLEEKYKSIVPKRNDFYKELRKYNMDLLEIHKIDKQIQRITLRNPWLKKSGIQDRTIGLKFIRLLKQKMSLYDYQNKVRDFLLRILQLTSKYKVEDELEKLITPNFLKNKRFYSEITKKHCYYEKVLRTLLNRRKEYDEILNDILVASEGDKKARNRLFEKLEGYVKNISHQLYDTPIVKESAHEDYKSFEEEILGSVYVFIAELVEQFYKNYSNKYIAWLKGQLKRKIKNYIYNQRQMKTNYFINQDDKQEENDNEANSMFDFTEKRVRNNQSDITKQVINVNGKDRYLIEGVAPKIGVVPSTLRRWEYEGKFIAKRYNSMRVYSEEDIGKLKKIRIKMWKKQKHKKDGLFTIKEIAKHIGKNVKTIKRAEKDGRIKKAQRDNKGNRIYTPKEAEEINRILNKN